MTWISDYEDILIMTPFLFGYLWAADQFCKKYLGASRKNQWLFLCFSFGGRLFLCIVSRLYWVWGLFLVVLSPVFFIGLVACLFRSDMEKRILAASILITGIRLAEDFCNSFLSCLFLFFCHTVKKIPEPILSRWEMGLIDGISGCFVIWSVYWMSKHLVYVFYGKPRKWYVILAVPLLVLTTVINVARWGASNGIMVRSGGNMGLYYDQIFSHAEFVVLTLLSMLAAGFYVFGMNRIYLEQEKNSRYHCQIAVYKMLADQHRQSERLRHDMKNHIIALSALFADRQWEKMGDYLKNLEDNGLEAGGDVTGNKAVDALLYQKRKRAKELKVRWECDVVVPDGWGSNEFDLCVLFGNILDNALEACERMGECQDRFINIQAKTVKKCFLLEVKNSMDRAEKYGSGSARKENPQEHGIGLLNVSDVVQRYNGVMNTEAENGVFVISVLMPLNGAHDIKPAL